MTSTTRPGFSGGTIYRDIAAISADNAEASASAAAVSAAAALDSEVAAANSASAAEASETAASASEAAALQAEIDAQTAQAAAEAAEASAVSEALDVADIALAIDKLYLGVFASDPALDNQGAGLQEGAWYFNSQTKGSRVYSDGSWENMTSVGLAALEEWEYVATEGQTDYTVDVLVPYYTAYVVGGKVPQSEITVAYPTVTLANSATAGDDVLIVGYGAVEMINGIPQIGHSTLLDLNADDHEQYVLADGSRAMASDSAGLLTLERTVTSGGLAGLIMGNSVDDTVATNHAMIYADSGNDQLGLVNALGATSRSLIVDSAGRVMSEDLVPDVAGQLVNKAHVDKYLPLAGGTLTGNLTLNAAPSTDLMAATKAYVDTLMANVDKVVYYEEFDGTRDLWASPIDFDVEAGYDYRIELVSLTASRTATLRMQLKTSLGTYTTAHYYTNGSGHSSAGYAGYSTGPLSYFIAGSPNTNSWAGASSYIDLGLSMGSLNDVSYQNSMHGVTSGPSTLARQYSGSLQAAAISNAATGFIIYADTSIMTANSGYLRIYRKPNALAS